MLCIAVIVALIRTIRASGRSGIKRDYVIDIVVYGVLGGVIFAHLGSILLNISFYLDDPSEIVNAWKNIFSPSGGVQGLSFHGGLVGGTFVVYLYARAKKLNFVDILDLIAPALALGYGITRIGCFLNGCGYGVPTSLPWGVRFPIGGGELTEPSHPAQLYAFLAGLVIYGILVMVERRRRFTGQVFYSFLLFYSIYRFLNEFVRKGVTADLAFWGLTQGQVASLIILILALFLLRRGSRLSAVESKAAGGE